MNTASDGRCQNPTSSMKKFGFILLWVCIAQVAFAQSYYREGSYIDGYDLKAGDITFHITSTGTSYSFNNVTNGLLDKPIMWRDGRRVTREEYEALEEGELDIASVKKAFQETFTEEEYDALKEGKDYMSLYMSIDTEGRMVEVSLYFDATPRTRAIPPEQYALLEKNLKKYLRYTLSEDEKKLQFLRLDIPIAFQHLMLYEKFLEVKQPHIDDRVPLTTP